MNNRIAFIILLLCPMTIWAQSNLQSVRNEIENNNLSLQALKQQVEAEKMGNKVGLAPENPEVEFAYLWGNQTAMGNRIDFSITQAFDFPSIYVYKNQIAKLKNEQVEMSYKKQKIEIDKEIAELYYNIVYQNVRIADMRTCLSHLSGIANSYAQKLKAGQINVFDYNKVKLTALNMEQELNHAQIERDALLLQLTQLNGGKSIDVSATEFPVISIISDFDQWYAQAETQNAMLLWLHKELEINKKQMSLNRTSWAPQFIAGYMSEQVPSEQFQGIKVGITLPLWRNLNAVKQVKLQNSAVNLLIYDEKNQFYNHLKTQHSLTISLLEQISNYQEVLAEVSQFELLHEALERGEIDLVNYLLEYSIYHESHERLFELYRDAAQNYIELELYGGK